MSPLKRGPVLRILWRLAGIAVGGTLAACLVFPPTSPMLLASLGGSAVFLFGLTHAPAAQPRALFGGHLEGALIGIACYQCFGEATWVYVLAITLTLGCMLLTKTVHPPAGANPLIMIHEHAGLAGLWHPVLAGAVCLAVVAFVWSRMVPGLDRYPRAWFQASPPDTGFCGWEE